MGKSPRKRHTNGRKAPDLPWLQYSKEEEEEVFFSKRWLRTRRGELGSVCLFLFEDGCVAERRYFGGYRPLHSGAIQREEGGPGTVGVGRVLRPFNVLGEVLRRSRPR